jgi:endonuclease YncB( thermonuclease family)
VYFGTECYGPQASATTKRLLAPGTRVRLFPEPATDRIDQYGRLLRYIIRVKDGLNVNVQLVRIGAAAPYFYEGRRGKYAALLERLALRARAKKLGLWGRCPHTPTTRHAESTLEGREARRVSRDVAAVALVHLDQVASDPLNGGPTASTK